MAWSTAEFRDRYTDLALFYDPGMWLYRALGMRIGAYRDAAIQSLRLKPGDTVVDLGCGTGLNFSRLHNAVGEKGWIIGVDLTPAMLEKARKRVDTNGWRNVSLVEADMSGYELPEETDGVLATLALSTVADYDQVVARAAKRLRPGVRLADFEMRWPERWPTGLANFGAWLNRPAGVTPDIVDRLPADAIRRYFTDVHYQEVYFGAAFICVGRASSPE